MEFAVAWLLVVFPGTSMIISGWDMLWIYFLILITLLLNCFWVSNTASATDSSVL